MIARLHGSASGCERAVFLDKDGTLVDDIPYNADPERVRLAPYVLEGLALLQGAGFRLIVVSNQAGIAKGFFTEAAWDRMRTYLGALFARHGIHISGFYHCPHHPEGSVAEFAVRCTCRKPLPGMLRRAAGEHGVDPQRSWMVGDILHDVEAGSRAGCKTVLIDNGNETEWEVGAHRMPDVMASDLLEAAQAILAEERNSRCAGVSTLSPNNPMIE